MQHPLSKFTFFFPTSLCGVLVFDSVSQVLLLLPPPASTTSLSHTTLSHTISHTQLCHTQLCHIPSFTHDFVTYHLSHTTLSHLILHTQLCHTSSSTHTHTPLCHTPSFTTPSFTHHFVTHHLSHITLSHTIFHHTIFHTQLCHTPSFATPSFAHHFVTHHLAHATLSHALFHTQLSHTPSFTHNFVTHTIFLRLTPSFTYNFVTHNFVLLVGPPPHPLSFLLSPSPLQHVVLIIGRSCLVELSGPLIFMHLENVHPRFLIKTLVPPMNPPFSKRPSWIQRSGSPSQSSSRWKKMARSKQEAPRTLKLGLSVPRNPGNSRLSAEAAMNMIVWFQLGGALSSFTWQ